MLGPKACTTGTRSDERASEVSLLPGVGGKSAKSKPCLTDRETEACSVQTQVLGVGNTKTR